MINLPEAYIKRIRVMLGEAADDFLNSYNQPKTQGLRINPLKLQSNHSSYQQIIDNLQLTAIPWCSTGFYYDEAFVRPGKHPYHAAGLYYIQNPHKSLEKCKGRAC
jgi:16S rRNA C967 or C1407 C5-methylase (RsmB/RsmF family)